MSKSEGPFTFGDRAFRFYTSLVTPRVPRGVAVMNPYMEPSVRGCLRKYLDKYFSDNRERVLILGINPGRFGAGVTGVTFADPVALADYCGIPNELPRRRELSSVFVYDVVNALGGPSEFHSRFFLSAVCPLGFTQDGVNLNYYDDRKLERAVTPFIVSSVEQHIALGGRRDHVVILGRGENSKFFTRLNDHHRWFGSIHSLDHPRFIMQYRRKKLDAYIEKYRTVLSSVSHGLG
ncbi:MAG: uracil-DNA glycosylase family protein [Gemmatimonadales bacterium]